MSSHVSCLVFGILGFHTALVACGESSRSSGGNTVLAGSGGGSGTAGVGGDAGRGGGSGTGGTATGGTSAVGGTGGSTGGAGGASGGKGGTAGSTNDAGKGGAVGGTGGNGGTAGFNPDGGVGGSLAGTGGSGGVAGAPEACEGFPDPMKLSCTRAGGCEGTGYCRFPGDPQPCGTFCFVDTECTSDDDCPDGVCSAYPASCCAEGTYSTRCLPRCTDTNCGNGSECGEDGRCTCVDELCPANQECRPSETGGTMCQRKPCENDDQCDCGGCFEGSCSPPPDVGVCELPVP